MDEEYFDGVRVNGANGLWSEVYQLPENFRAPLDDAGSVRRAVYLKVHDCPTLTTQRAVDWEARRLWEDLRG